jgi:aminoglycoside phosphotransferase (APT) family kinase protein
VTSDITRNLASSLAPVLKEACEQRLSDIVWFKTDWQRGGAATGRATYRDDDGDDQPVIVKLPVVQREFRWARALQNGQAKEPIVPRVYAAGMGLDDYDLAWIVMEKFEHGPLALHWHEDHIPRMAEAIARFHLATQPFPVDQRPRVEDWDILVEEAAENVRMNHIGDERRWGAALKKLQSILNKIVSEWDARPINQWLHGDAHPANMMSRVAEDHGPVALIDLAEVHAGHWVEDAVYFERLLWTRPELMKPHKPVKTIAAERKKLGLQVEAEDSRLAMIRRALLAGTAPSFMKTEGNPHHLAACLDRLEIAVKEVA